MGELKQENTETINLKKYTTPELVNGTINFYNIYGQTNPNKCAMLFKTMSNALGYEIKNSIGELPNGTTVNAWHMSQTLIKDGYTRKGKSEFNGYSREDLENLPIGTAFLIRHPSSSSLEKADKVIGGDGSTHVAILVEIEGEKKIVDLRGMKVRITSIDEYITGTGEGRGLVNLKNTRSIMIPDETKKVEKYEVKKIPKYSQNLQNMLNESYAKNGSNGKFQLAAAIQFIEKQKEIALKKIGTKKV